VNPSVKIFRIISIMIEGIILSMALMGLFLTLAVLFLLTLAVLFLLTLAVLFLLTLAVLSLLTLVNTLVKRCLILVCLVVVLMTHPIQ
jgi:hypothetical protein